MGFTQHDIEAANKTRWQQVLAERARERFDESLLSDERYVFVKAYRCPFCHSDALKSNRSEDQRDGSRKRWSQCKTCDRKFFLIIE